MKHLLWTKYPQQIYRGRVAFSILEAQERQEAVSHQPLKMKNACSGVGRHKEVRSTEGAADCLEEEGCERETAIGDVSAGL